MQQDAAAGGGPGGGHATMTRLGISELHITAADSGFGTSPSDSIFSGSIQLAPGLGLGRFTGTDSDLKPGPELEVGTQAETARQ